MTTKEALGIAMKDLNSYQLKVKEGRIYLKKVVEYFEIVVGALDKQIPRKVERKERFDGHCYYCGRCHKRIEDAGHDYCGYCGTLLAWSEVE